MNYDKIVSRTSREEFFAWMAANSMQSLEGVDVVSIVFRAGVPYDCWYIYAKIDSARVDETQIDKAICDDQEVHFARLRAPLKEAEIERH